MKNYSEKTCAMCGRAFKPNGPNARHCTDCSYAHISEYSKKYDVDHGRRLSGRGAMEYRPKVCVVCGIEFAPTSGGQKYCSGKCYQFFDKLHSHEIRLGTRKPRIQRTPNYKPKSCRTCGTEFIPKQSKSLYCSNECKLKYWAGVAAEIRKNRTPEEKERYIIGARDAYLSRKYGITNDEYDVMSAAQDHKCAICGSYNYHPDSKKRCSLAVDHDHITGEVRGLLCRQCNLIIGYASDNVNILASAMDYLNKVAAQNRIKSHLSAGLLESLVK